MEHFNIDEDILELMFELNGRELDSFVDIIEDSICEDDIDLYIFVALFFSQKVGCLRAAQCAIHACDSWTRAGASDSNELVRRQRIQSHLIHQQQHLHLRIQWPWGQISIVDRMVTLYRNTRDMRHLDAAISLNARQLASVPTSYKCWAKFAKTLYGYLVAKAKATSTESDFRATIDFINTAAVAAQGHVLESELSHTFGADLLDVYTRTKDPIYLERAILFSRKAVETCREGDPELHERNLLLGDCIATRHASSTRSQDDLNEAISSLTLGLEGISIDGEPHLDRQARLASCLHVRYDTSTDETDLRRALDISSHMVATVSEHHPKYHQYLAMSGICLYKKYKLSAKQVDYDLAVERLTGATDIRPGENSYNFWLFKVHFARYQRTKSVDTLHSAMKCIETAYNSNNAVYGLDMARCLKMRSEETGCASDLDRAIEIATRLLEAKAETDKKTASIYHSELAAMLNSRYVMAGSLGDLDYGINLAEKATLLDNQNILAHYYLSRLLGERFWRSEHVPDINRAIEAAETASGLDHRGLGVSFSNNLADLLLKRYSHTNSNADLDRARKLSSTSNERTASTPNDHFGLGLYWFSRARVLQNEGTTESIKSSIECLRKVLEFLPSDNIFRATALLIIVECTTIDFSGPNVEDEIDRARLDLKECWNCRAAPLHIRMRIVNQAAETTTPEDACPLLREAIEEFPKLFPRSLSNDDRQSLLETVSDIASNAAYYHLRNGADPATALGFLEVGRSVLSNILMEMRTDTSDLTDAHPDLAQRFTTLVDQLDSTTQSLQTDPESLKRIQPVKWESNAAQRRKADTEFATLLEEIRTRPGFEGFLLPLKSEDMMKAADPDPIIVINLHNIVSDAFIIESHRIRAISLPDISRDKVGKKADELRSTLRYGSRDMKTLLKWLWDVVCLPCLKALGFDRPVTDGKWPRVWWVPTGGLSQFPLHAAGIYEGDSTETVLDCVMSSYAVSINALRHGRRLRAKLTSDISERKKALLVSMRSTTGQDNLRFAEEEVNTLNDFCPQLGLDPVTPKCTRKDVIQHLERCHIFHFAGHGNSHPNDPSKSMLLLEDWQTEPLTVGDLRETKLQNHPPFLGYLSACSTGSNQKTKLLDEGVHLVGAFQLAGFRHVVGTLWAISDRNSADVARSFYEVLKREGMTDRAVCQGVHEALRILRKQQAGETYGSRAFKWPTQGKTVQSWGDQTWIPYVHFGV